MASQNAALDERKIEAESLAPAELEEALPEPASRKSARSTLLLWLVAASLLVFFLPLYLFSASVSEDTKGLDADLGFIRTALTRVPTAVPAIARLLTPIAQTQAQLNQIATVYPTVAATRPNWPVLMTVIGNYDPNQISLASITRTVNSLVITGRANSDAAVTAYAHSLEQSNLFSQVVVQSIHTGLITPTVASTRANAGAPIIATAPNGVAVQPTPYNVNNAPPPQSNPPTSVAVSQPIAPAPAATPDLRDPFEPDDTQPPPIALGQPQTHNFYPTNDVDNVSFLAKAGHYYHVYTTALAPGVDTLLAVRIGGLVLSNDDVRPGTLSSDVVIQNTGPDTTAVATISNRGMYGPDKTYEIVVEEVTATPTATPTNTSTPTATPTNTSTPTATPTPLPTSTLIPVPTNTTSPTPTATAAPTLTPKPAASSFQGKQVPGLAAPIRSNTDRESSASGLSLDTPAFEFVIIAELKGSAP